MLKVLKTKRLLLRPFSTDDLYSTHAYAGNKNNAKYMVFLPNETMEDTKQFLSDAAAEWEKEYPDFYEFAITLNAKHIGAVSIYLDESHVEGELGWILHKDFWGNGYAAEAASAIKEFAVNDLKLKKLIAHCDSRNLSSCRVMEKIGLILEDDSGIRYNKGSSKPAKELMYSFLLDRE